MAEGQRPFGRRAALLLVDIQKDFSTGGVAEVPNSQEILPICNVLRKKIGWDAIVLAQDWHPAKHTSFCTANILQGRYCRIGDTITLPSGIEQKMWPDHCVENSEGADFPTELNVDADDLIIQKGTNADVDSYSAFLANDGVSTTELYKKLSKLNITDLYICGLGMEYGVGSTAADAVKLGFNTFIVRDAIKGYANDTTKEMAIKLEKAGVATIESMVLIDYVESKEDKRQIANEYMQKNNISILFQNLCTALVYNKPEDPKQFLIKELQRLQKDKKVEPSKISLLNDDDYETMFHMLDPIKIGTISASQVKKALAGLGLKPAQEIIDDEIFNITKFKEILQAAK